MKDEKLIEKQLTTTNLYKGIILDIYSDTVQLPNKKQATREYLKHLGAVCIIPITHDKKVIMERQYRYPVGRVVLEIPAGKLDSADEDPLDAAQRELKEETGYTADEWISLGHYMPAPAYSSEYIGVYMARGLHRGQQHLDDEEFLDVIEIPLEELVEDVMKDKISDGKTQIAILKAHMMLS